MRVFWHADGCKVNLADLESLLGALPPGSWRPCADLDQADLALFNTCTVTHKADADWRKMLSCWRRRRPRLPVVVSGCAAVFQAERIASFSNVRAVVRPGDVGAWLRVFAELQLAEEVAGAEGLAGTTVRLGRHRALLKIQDGCASRCSYCLVSLVRGEEQSLPEEKVLEEMQRRLEAGFQEVVLCGINLGRYGRSNGNTLARLLRRIRGLRRPDSRWRLRLSSIEPPEWSEDLLQALGECDFVCRHFHVPLQSADDRLLGLMRRPYRSGEALELLQRLRGLFPRAALGSDWLVGFPGEGEEEFRRMLEFAQDSPLDYLHVFAFSPRPGTEAGSMPGRVPPPWIRQRVTALRRLGAEKWRRFINKGVGSRHRVIAEKLDGRRAEGRSEHYRRVVFSGARVEAGACYEVYGEQAAGEVLEGRLVDEC